ncbi:oxysterol-binding protein OSH6 NDAI_0K02010 [Naumovozyma dairenensis CBS 421]|uniref:Oxysterol-binding protein n=1 Tax=Naumovozyma dairenensis (strain ATCC 10597 / BCRC 20456 / CBS 421 / NBRC 0211 / NRRL Y-12639) TaxID=1071378 RepID=G0WHY1_NAUDC|nr:hypothetical protein NDAI_0K02010 [Naumovozyma dairenensis CBS 421]CCD27392.1 hypothetical protein NDAI_0K02010 [Naumovozyma dairenensis CBS 421]
MGLETLKVPIKGLRDKTHPSLNGKSSAQSMHSNRSSCSSVSQCSSMERKSNLNDESGTRLDTDDIDEEDESGQNILMNIISQLKPGCDLSRITLPTFILEKKSMLERITNSLQFPDILMDAHIEPNELQRFIKVVKFYLAGWHIAPKAVKKPLNPVLGEYFTCYWDLPNKQQAFYVAEQTRHHPPESSYFYMIPESQIRIDGIVVPKSRFLGNSSAAMMEGLTVLQFLDLNEKYTLTQPNMYARGILFGKMKFELGDHMIIKGPNYNADILFKTKGYISGTYDSIEGTIKNNAGESLYSISGKWNDVMYIKDLKDSKNGGKRVLFDTHTSKTFKPKVRPLEEQGEYESRRLWNKVTNALAVRNHEVATAEKSKIEDYQRELAKERLDSDVPFHPKLFRKVDDPSKELNFYIYKHIPKGNNYEAQIKSILEIAPILPGQKFTHNFETPGYKKYQIEEEALKRHSKG